MGNINRREFIGHSVRVGGAAILASKTSGFNNLFAADKKFKLNVGYLPISDHLILPVSHALNSDKYKYITVKPYLCKSWEEILGKLDMGILNAAFLLAPLAMSKYFDRSNIRCILFGYRNGSVIATEKAITNYKGLLGKTVGVPHTKSTHTVLLYKYLHDKGIKNLDDVKLVTVNYKSRKNE